MKKFKTSYSVFDFCLRGVWIEGTVCLTRWFFGANMIRYEDEDLGITTVGVFLGPLGIHFDF